VIEPSAPGENPSDANSRLADVLDGYFRAVADGNAPSRDELLAAHPDLAEDLEAALFGLEFVRGAAPSLSTESDAAPVEPDRSLGDYRLIREVGRGGMAVVYEAEQVSLGRRVALKVLPFASVLDPKQLQRFKNEALAVAGLRHPNIVPVHAVGCERGVHYYAMQLIEGQSLAQAIRDLKEGPTADAPKTPLSSHGSHRTPGYVRTAVALCVQAAEALDHAHQLGIVHRDVKPANLLVDPAGTLWVTDFGLASSRKDAGLTTTGEIVGTVRYMSPEQALAKRVPVDHRTDVYSLGATLYELLTLEPAFPGDDPHAVMRDIASREPVPPRQRNPALPVDVETVLMKAMTKDPAGRYGTAQEMADDLKRYLTDRPVLARRASVVERVVRWSRRHRAGVAATVVVLLVGAGALAIGAKQEERKTREALAKAEENLDRAYLAVKRFLSQTVSTTLSNSPTLTPDTRADLEKALEFYDRYLTERRDAAGHVDRSGALSLLERYDEAVLAAERAIQIDPTLQRAHFARGVALRRLGRPEEALREFDRSLELAPDRPESLLERGIALQELKRPEEALASWDRAIRLAPEKPQPHNNRGLYFDSIGKHAEALENYDRALKAEPRYYVTHVNRSISLSRLGRLPEALEAIDRALALNPDEARGHLQRGSVLDRLKRFPEALAATERAIALDPKMGRPHYNRAVMLDELGRHEEVLASLDRSIELEPTYAPAHLNRGEWLRLAGRYPEALEAADRAIALDPGLALARWSRANTLLALHRVAEAMAEDERVLEAMPNDASLLNEIAWHRATSKDPLVRDPPRAVEYARRAVKIAPDQGAIWNTLGAALCQTESWAQALDALTRSVELRAEGDAHDWFFLAIANAGLRRKGEARKWFDRAVDWADANAKGDAGLAEIRADAAKALQ
jgi:tetratricopeptide (TPR) repeat protein